MRCTMNSFSHTNTINTKPNKSEILKLNLEQKLSEKQNFIR